MGDPKRSIIEISGLQLVLEKSPPESLDKRL
jgi:hypothetical protein